MRSEWVLWAPAGYVVGLEVNKANPLQFGCVNDAVRYRSRAAAQGAAAVWPTQLIAMRCPPELSVQAYQSLRQIYRRVNSGPLLYRGCVEGSSELLRHRLIMRMGTRWSITYRGRLYLYGRWHLPEASNAT